MLKIPKEQTVRLLTRLDWRLAPSQPLVNIYSGFFLKSFRQRKNSKAFELHPISWIFLLSNLWGAVDFRFTVLS